MSSPLAGALERHAPVPVPAGPCDERAARRTMRAQIGRLEAELAGAFVRGFEMRDEPVAPTPGPLAGPARLLDLGELELVRDDLDRRLRAADAAIERDAVRQSAKRAQLAQMLLEPGHHRFETISRRELGESGCGVYAVRPRMGLIGMLMGWWQVTLSSGCPLAGGRRPARVRPWP